jgi:1-aminocyclopropane-1-carboxylate deaminase/D-cysteine desulfhydrase-like pyridoxal-dependent ACC family enzyme
MSMDVEQLIERVGRMGRVGLGTLPTPLLPLPSFSMEVGVEVWIKRDDLTGFAFGGNKVRKMEFLLADALRRECDVLLTVGGAQSNHARTVAAAAATHGIACHLVLGGPRPRTPTGNLLLDRLFGAELHFGETEDWAILEGQMNELASQLTQEGHRPYTIPIGGSTGTGALGFVAAFAEFTEQCDALKVSPRWIVHATSTGGTQAGLEAARRTLGRDRPRILGVAVAKTGKDLSEEVAKLVAEVQNLIGGDPGAEPFEVFDGSWGRLTGSPPRELSRHLPC